MKTINKTIKRFIALMIIGAITLSLFTIYTQELSNKFVKENINVDTVEVKHFNVYYKNPSNI